jgi:hypothetical protein
MKQYTIAIPDDKEAFFQEFMRMVGIYVIEAGDTDVPQWHIDLVRERVATASNENMLNWDEVKNKLRLD